MHKLIILFLLIKTFHSQDLIGAEKTWSLADSTCDSANSGKTIEECYSLNVTYYDNMECCYLERIIENKISPICLSIQNDQTGRSDFNHDYTIMRGEDFVYAFFCPGDKYEPLKINPSEKPTDNPTDEPIDEPVNDLEEPKNEEETQGGKVLRIDGKLMFFLLLLIE